MNTKQNTNWWVDFALFTGFITTYFLNLTGVAVHQWIGLSCGALAAYHLFLHRDWVAAIYIRFFKKTSLQARKNFILDILLLLGFVLIGISGLAISTWLKIPLNNFITWLNFHITISITTLMILFLKLIFHWRWIVHTSRKIWAGTVLTRSKNTAVQPVKTTSSRMGRRDFLNVMAIAGAASFLALASATKSLTETGNASVIVEAVESDDNQTTSNQSSSLFSTSDCTVRCRRACSYPGHCNRYADTNNNGRCDLGECA